MTVPYSKDRNRRSDVLGDFFLFFFKKKKNQQQKNTHYTRKREKAGPVENVAPMLIASLAHQTRPILPRPKTPESAASQGPSGPAYKQGGTGSGVARSLVRVETTPKSPGPTSSPRKRILLAQEGLVCVCMCVCVCPCHPNDVISHRVARHVVFSYILLIIRSMRADFLRCYSVSCSTHLCYKIKQNQKSKIKIE
ncbi:hypothetical protein LZ32DRAFT_336569 [Colletotrichum eremochloae]|nr:hypothetical protein LZ32DRAFT_336569 [Colletotrichum eremochloae]